MLGAIMLFSSCDPKGNGNTDPTPFDRSVMLQNWVNNIIVPAFNSFNVDLNLLDVKMNAFKVSRDLDNLEKLREAWLVALKGWQKIALYNIGKAEEINYRNRINIYPVNTDKIESFVEDGGYNLELPSNIDAQGFQAMDYMLYGIANSDQAILDKFTNPTSGDAYMNYFFDLFEAMNYLTSQVISNWTTEGFAAQFIENEGTSANASVDKLVNEFLFYYERNLRAGKVGIPAGVFSSSPLPENVEAFYSKEFSKELLLLSLQAIQGFFNGSHFGSNNTGESLKSYLIYITELNNTAPIHELINGQFENAINAITLLDKNFINQINTDNTAMLKAYDALQKNVVLMKVDMLQALSINVSYVDADGD